MREFQISEKLDRILYKLSKKDPSLHRQVMKKIKGIIASENIENYKNLRHEFRDSKRVHVGHFVLIFQYKKEKDSILFDDFDHHDKIYKK